jgi:hypothetical protein
VAEATEIERLVGELELAVDRVRSLYEQYFMGIEKLEPTVPRKDVDRRIHILRKEQIRNTAQRFRFQMVVQRYNTYQTHWQRICREIEGGTYKRHLIRAKRRFGGASPGSVRPPPGATLSRELAEELAALDREFAPDAEDDLEIEVVADAPKPKPSVPRPGPPRPAPPRPAPSSRPVPTRPEPPRAAASSHPVVPPRPELPRPAPSHAEPPRPVPPARPASSAPDPLRPGAPAPLWRKAPPAPPIAPGPPHAPAVGGRTAGPQAATFAPAPARAGPVIPPAAPEPRASAGDLSEDRVRAIYSQYVEAKRRQNESTAAITYDAVAKSLRDSSARLREKHGRHVDFEVAVKDGKAILKPVLK